MEDTRTLTINGQQQQLVAGTVAELVVELGYPPEGRGLAVAVDGKIVPRSQWSVTDLPALSAVDIVGAVQGG